MSPGLPGVRAAALAEAWRDPAIRGIVAVRGGYGSQQLLPLLDPRWLLADPKVFIGYSDLTALLAWQVGHGQVAFHGPDGRGPARARPRRLRPRFVPRGRDPASGDGHLGAGRARGVASGRGVGRAHGGHAHPAGVAPGHALRLPSARADHPVPRRRGRAALSPRSPADAAAPGRDVPPRHRRGARRVPGLRRGRRRANGAGGAARSLRSLPGPGRLGFPSGHTVGAALTLPFGVSARLLAGSTRRRSRSKSPRSADGAPGASHRDLRHGHGHACGAAQGARRRRAAAPTSTSIRP